MNNQGNVNIKNEMKGRGLFYGIIAVATFIVMAVGATFAYFTATTRSSNTAVTAGSTTLQLQYISYETAWSNNDLIPADTNVVQYSFEFQNDTTLNSGTLNAESGNLLCKDDYGNSICSVYVFQVTNSAASPQTLSMSVVSNLNTFSNLHAIAYGLSVEADNMDAYNSEENNNGLNDPNFKIGNSENHIGNVITVTDGAGEEVTNFTPIYVNRNGVTKTLLSNKKIESDEAESTKLVTVLESNSSDATSRTVTVAENFVIQPNQTNTFALVLFVKNLESDQTDADAAKSFTGQVVVGPGDGSATGVSGYISAVSNPQE